MMTKRFSIITITYHNLNGLKRTQDSLTTQTCSDYEWIVIDGGSSDGTKEHLQTTKALWISEPDGSIYDAMNKGIDRAAGQYLLFMNARDCFASVDVLEKIHTSISNSQPDFIYGDALETSEHKNAFYKKARSHAKAARGMFTHHQAMMYKRETISNMHYDLTYKIAADYDFTLRFLKKAEHVLYCPFPICLFESGGLSQQNANTGRREEYHIRKTVLKTPLLINIIVSTRQFIAYHLRQTCPAFYRFWAKIRQYA